MNQILTTSEEVNNAGDEILKNSLGSAQQVDVNSLYLSVSETGIERQRDPQADRNKQGR